MVIGEGFILLEMFREQLPKENRKHKVSYEPFQKH